jgi:predicted DNA-binding transcriptional regulator YafY
LRNDFRTFRLDRVSDLKVTSTNFENEPGKDLATYLARAPRESTPP